MVTGAQRIEVRTGNRKLLAHMIKGDLVNDLALLKVEGQFVPLPLGASRTTRLCGSPESSLKRRSAIILARQTSSNPTAP